MIQLASQRFVSRIVTEDVITTVLCRCLIPIGFLTLLARVTLLANIFAAHIKVKSNGTFPGTMKMLDDMRITVICAVLGLIALVRGATQSLRALGIASPPFLIALVAVLIESKAVFAQPLGTLNVMEYGAKTDGTTDNTDAFQKALDAAAQKGGIVYVPAGTYRIAGSLNVPQSVTLRGVWEAPHSADVGKGSVIDATGGAGDENGPPLISLNQSSCVEGLTIFYPEQDADKLKPYPWTIQGRGSHGSVIDVTLVNPYKGIDFGTHPNQLHYIRNVYGCPLKIGIFVDKTTDIGRIENVHFNPGAWEDVAYPNAPKGDTMERLIGWLHQNLVGFVIGRTDWEYMNNCFVIVPKIGFHFVETDSGADTGSPNVELTQCGSDVCEVAVQVDASQEHAGIAFSNSQFMAQAIVSPTNKGPVKFSNCGFWARGATTNQAVIDGSGTTTFTACHFASWARKEGAEEAACILVKGGSVIVNGCEFFAEAKGRHELHNLGCGGKKQIELGPGTQSAAIFGNRFRGGENIVNNAPAGASIKIGLNVQ